MFFSASFLSVRITYPRYAVCHPACFRTRAANRSTNRAPSGREHADQNRRTHCLRSDGPLRVAACWWIGRCWCCHRAKPRGSAPECRVDPAFRRLQAKPPRHRAASHNGARYATLPHAERGKLSGTPPRCLQAEKSGSRTRHTFRPSGNPSG